ncbi:hypothetical protein D3C71_1979930 [compost metagenome]
MRVALGDGGQSGVCKNDIGRNIVFLGDLGTPGLEVDEAHLLIGPQVLSSGSGFGAARATAAGFGGTGLAQLHGLFAPQHGA